MATGTASRGASPKPSKSGVLADQRERFIETQLRKTRNQVRSVELTTRLLVLMVGIVVYFLVVSLIDHWVVPGGMGIWTRLLCLAVLLIGGAVYLFQQIVPLFLYRVNSVYAAHTIERTKPSLKNSLVNFLMLRSHRSDVPEIVFSAIEEQAASNLSTTSIDHAVDRGKVIQLGYVLIGIVAVFCLYFILSPKSPLQTVGRVVLPWADISPASRVVLRDVQPGTSVVFRGEHVEISAEISRLRESEPVRLIYSTADRQLIDQTVDMKMDDTGLRYIATLPQMESTSVRTPQNGVQQDIDYRIEAGDASSQNYRLTVVQAPNILVDKVEYNYPAYIGRSREVVEQTGDLRGIEGTRVTIHATANQTIKSAYIDFEADGRNKKSMTVKGDKATATFELSLNQQRSGPQYGSYVLRFVTESDKPNREPIRYRIEVTPDYAPDISILEPSKSVTEAPLNSDVPFKVQASDPDFALAKVKLLAKVRGNVVLDQTLFPTADEKLYTGQFSQKFSLRFDQLAAVTTQLRPGDEVVYWAEATDNKSPHANVSKTAERTLKLLAPLANQPANRRENDPTKKEGATQPPKNTTDPDQSPDRDPKTDEENPLKEENENDPKKDDPANAETKTNERNKADQPDQEKQPPKTDTEQAKQPKSDNDNTEENSQEQGKSQENQSKDSGGDDSKKTDSKGDSKGGGKSGTSQAKDQSGGGKGGDPTEDNSSGTSGENPSRGSKTDSGKAEQSGKDKKTGSESGAPSGEQTGERTERPDGTGQDGARPEETTPKGGTPSDPKQSPRPVPTVGADGDALERALEDLEKQSGKSREQLMEEMAEKLEAEKKAHEKEARGDKPQQPGTPKG
ncbi:MAG: hypothetical protein SGJ20_19490, partial [Planctomycetota bacterium]|nr:hypothetical protein [Planctomycetota bacterium]